MRGGQAEVCVFAAARLRAAAGVKTSAMNPARAGLSACRGPAGPVGSHHS